MNLHGACLVLLALIGVFWLQAVLTLRLFFVKGTHRPQIHHFYYGGAMVIVAPWPWTWVVGLLVALDDAVQHTMQEDHPTYLSPLHRAYVWVYYLLPWRVRQWLDHF